MFFIEDEGGMEAADGAYLVDTAVARLVGYLARLLDGLGESVTALCFELGWCVLEVTEQASDVARRRDVVVDVGDEGDLVADCLASACIRGF